MSCRVACFRWTASWWKDAGERMWHLDQGPVAEGHSQSWQVDVTSCCTLNVHSMFNLNAWTLLNSCVAQLSTHRNDVESRHKWCPGEPAAEVFKGYGPITPGNTCVAVWTLSAVHEMPIQESFFMTTVVTSHMQHSCTACHAAPFLLTWFQACREPCTVSQGTPTKSKLMTSVFTVATPCLLPHLAPPKFLVMVAKPEGLELAKFPTAAFSLKCPRERSCRSQIRARNDAARFLVDASNEHEGTETFYSYRCCSERHNETRKWFGDVSEWRIRIALGSH